MWHPPPDAVSHEWQRFMSFWKALVNCRAFQGPSSSRMLGSCPAASLCRLPPGWAHQPGRSCRLLLVMPCVYDSFVSNTDPATGFKGPPACRQRPQVMSEWEQGLLAINTFAQGFAVTYMLRLLHRFKRRAAFLAAVSSFWAGFSRSSRPSSAARSLRCSS